METNDPENKHPDYIKAKKHLVNLTKKYANEMLPVNTPITIKFGKILGESDGQIAPQYIFGRGGKPSGVKFTIKYNEDFVDANKHNLKSHGITGLVVHELNHARDFLINTKGYLNNAHTNPVFKSGLAKYMNTTIGSKKYRSAMKPDPSTRCYNGKCKYNVVPAWTSEYWIYFCPNCGFVDSYTTNLKTKSPICENCKNRVGLITKKLPATEAAKMDVIVQMKPKNYNSDKELEKFIFKMLKKYTSPPQWLKIQNALKRIKRKA